MSDLPEVRNQSFDLNILSQQPTNQFLEMKNTNPEQPIQLRVDTVTDYTALFITIFISLITAIISAYVTIKIVTKSNKDLIDSQDSLQNQRAIIEKNNQLALLTSKNRQDWINELRDNVAEIISESANITHNLRAMLHVKYKQNTIGDLDFTIFMSSYQKVDSLIARVSLFLNENKTEQKRLTDELSDLKKNLLKFCNLNMKPDKDFYSSSNLPILKKNLEDNMANVSKETSLIIQMVWDQIKSGE